MTTPLNDGFADAESLRYLDGSKFSNALQYTVPSNLVIERDQLLERIAREKQVLHVGCADHLELIALKRREGRYLHDRLVESASRVIGSDVNREALDAMKSHGFTDLYVPEDVPRDARIDIVLAPDVIEHVDDVGRFLEGLSTYGCDVVITTPNAFRLQNRTQWRRECINSDHRYWFSPYTLARALMSSGYQIQEFWMTDTLYWHQPIRNGIKRRYPLARDGLAVRATPPPG